MLTTSLFLFKFSWSEDIGNYFPIFFLNFHEVKTLLCSKTIESILFLKNKWTEKAQIKLKTDFIVRLYAKNPFSHSKVQILLI